LSRPSPLPSPAPSSLPCPAPHRCLILHLLSLFSPAAEPPRRFFSQKLILPKKHCIIPIFPLSTPVLTPKLSRSRLPEMLGAQPDAELLRQKPGSKAKRNKGA